MRSDAMISETPSHEPRPVASLGSKSVSVVICCYNGAKRLPETLRHLTEQKVPPEVTWEIVLVDNASTDETVQATQRFAETHPNLPIRIVSEERPGQTYARLRGLKEARGRIILYVDDDNWLHPDYVGLVAQTMEERPEIVALGGMSTAVYEQEPPDWMCRHQRWYAVSGPPRETDQLAEVDFLWGAGTAFRRASLERIVNDPFLLPGRKGTALPAGDDHELCCRLQSRGEKLFCHPGLRFEHYLPARRVQWGYLRRMCYAEGEVSVMLDMYRLSSSNAKHRWPVWLLRSWLAQVCNVYWQVLKHPIRLWRARRDLMEGDDLVLRIETYRGRLSALMRHRRDYR